MPSAASPALDAQAMELAQLASDLPAYIYEFRGQRVMLDSDLAALYGVRTAELTRIVKRHPTRFPPDFAFQLRDDEFEDLRYRIGTSKEGRGGRRYAPYVFTEQGVAMLSSVLNSERAVRVNIEIMRAFVRLRRMAIEHEDLARRIDELEARYDGQLADVFDALRELSRPPATPARRLGFPTGDRPA
jgi:hypothetical protein